MRTGNERLKHKNQYSFRQAQLAAGRDGCFDICNIKISSQIICRNKFVLSKPICAEVCYFMIYIFLFLDLSGRHELRLLEMSLFVVIRGWLVFIRVFGLWRIFFFFAQGVEITFGLSHSRVRTRNERL